MTVTDSNINTYETGQTILDIVAGQTVRVYELMILAPCFAE